MTRQKHGAQPPSFQHVTKLPVARPTAGAGTLSPRGAPVVSTLPLWCFNSTVAIAASFDRDTPPSHPPPPALFCCPWIWKVLSLLTITASGRGRGALSDFQWPAESGPLWGGSLTGAPPYSLGCWVFLAKRLGKGFPSQPDKEMFAFATPGHILREIFQTRKVIAVAFESFLKWVPSGRLLLLPTVLSDGFLGSCIILSPRWRQVTLSPGRKDVSKSTKKTSSWHPRIHIPKAVLPGRWPRKSPVNRNRRKILFRWIFFFSTFMRK